MQLWLVEISLINTINVKDRELDESSCAIGNKRFKKIKSRRIYSFYIFLLNIIGRGWEKERETL